MRRWVVERAKVKRDRTFIIGFGQNSGVVDENINFSELLLGRRKSFFEIGFAADVAGDETEAVGEIVGNELVADHHLGTGSGKPDQAIF